MGSYPRRLLTPSACPVLGMALTQGTSPGGGSSLSAAAFGGVGPLTAFSSIRLVATPVRVTATTVTTFQPTFLASHHIPILLPWWACA